MLGALLVTSTAPATDVKLWPLFRYTSGPGDAVHWTALGPLIEFRRTSELHELHIRPLLWLQRHRGPQRDDRADILFPLISARWQDRFESFRFLLFTYRASAEDEPPGVVPAPDRWTRRMSLFPFVFYRHDPADGTRLGVLPFYLDLPDFLGYERVQAVMLPAFLRLTQPQSERRFYGFPFVSVLAGPHTRGLFVWPFVGIKEVEGQERSGYLLWPFHIRSERFVPGRGWERTRVNFPFFAARDAPGLSSRAYGLTSYTRTVDERAGYEAIGSPWPIVYRRRMLGDTQWQTERMGVVYGYTDVEGYSARYYAWPAYRWKRQEAPDFTFERRDVGLILWRHQEQWTEGSHEALETLVPLLRSREVNGRRFGQVPALADSLLPVDRGVLGLWAPLWAVFRWDTAPDGGRDWNLLWGLVAREGGELRGPWYLSASGEVSDGGLDDR